jgi:hypothetical protein
MPGKRLMWTGLIGFIVGLIALLVCLLLPVALGPNVSWGEAMLGIIPSAILAVVFLVLMLIGMATAVSSAGERRRRDVDWDDDVGDSQTRRRPPRQRDDYDDDECNDEPRRQH